MKSSSLSLATLLSFALLIFQAQAVYAQGAEAKLKPAKEAAAAAAPAPASSSAASGQIYIKVGEAQIKRSLLALTPFQFLGVEASGQDLGLGRALYSIISSDLDFSGYFTMIDPKAYLENPMEVGLRPAPGQAGGFHFEKWKTIGAEFLIRGGYNMVAGELQLQVYVYYVPRAELVLGRSYRTQLSGVHKLAHTFSNDLVKALTGQKGMFLSRIVVSSNRGVKPAKEIFIMDWDGENIKQLSRHHSVSISPAISPDARYVAYTSFTLSKSTKLRNANLLLLDRQTSRFSILSNQTGINSGAAFYPQGGMLLFTLSQGGNPDIYPINLDKKLGTPLTRGPLGAMNVEPAFGPDGNTIAFSSDRAGSPMIYTMNLSTKEVKRVTYAGKYNANPAFSPDGKLLAFAGYDKTHFDIFIMNVDGTGMKRLTSAFKKNGRPANNEDPTFSPDGRYIMFTSNRSGSYQLYITTIEGISEKAVTHDNFDYYKPRWTGVYEP